MGYLLCREETADVRGCFPVVRRTRQARPKTWNRLDELAGYGHRGRTTAKTLRRETPIFEADLGVDSTVFEVGELKYKEGNDLPLARGLAKD